MVTVYQVEGVPELWYMEDVMILYAPPPPQLYQDCSIVFNGIFCPIYKGKIFPPWGLMVW